MAANQLNTIYPCPFSKGYGIPVDQAWSLLNVFFIYRLIISSLFVAMFYSDFDTALLDNNDKYSLSYFSQSYFVFTALSGICAVWRLISYTAQAQIVIFTDIAFITLLMHGSGGIYSGIGILLVVSIAAGGLLIGGRCALLFAALASLSILSEQLYTISSNTTIKTSFTYAGMLGASFFTIAYLSYVLAKRTEQSENLASLHQLKVLNLEELNQYIIQHLQSGIIISNSQQHIKMCNESALKIFYSAQIKAPVFHLAGISTQLSECFEHWLNDSHQDFALIQLSNHTDIHLRFSVLKTQQESFHMIILEDASLYNQKLQQNKLASLGRLTASIAHEIRNPLGAISHAGQLLSESSVLSIEEKRLTEIIQNHSLRVNKIIEDVLQLSRRQLSRREKININEWIQSYLHNFIQEVACDSECFIIDTKDVDLWVYIDEGHLTQILNNLCSNALKYGDLNCYKIIIELGVCNEHPYISVMNKGVPIEKEIAAHLFEPFFTTSSTGTGLGLYISKELAELNQAKLSYASTDDNRTRFKLSMPRADNSMIEI